MPAKKKSEEKREEEEAVEETGTFVFDNDAARFTGTILRKEGTCKRIGKGVYEDAAIRYEGDWHNDLMHGRGTLTFAATGSVYAGSFYEGRFDGGGIFRWADGSCYEGYWRLNRMHGEGRYTDVSGKAWHGMFYNGTGPGLRPSVGVM